MPASPPCVILLAAFGAIVSLSGQAQAHVVPNTTMEADFSADGSYAVRINVDPRTFMAADPTTLPPVPASWYREQTPEEVAATHEKARAYLEACLRLVFSGDKAHLPKCEFQAINGDDNTPINAQSQEVHLLATGQGRVPEGASTFRLDFAKAANTSLILLTTQPGKAAPRAQVVFPGELSKEVVLRDAPPARPVPAVEPRLPSSSSPPPAADSMNQVWLGLVAGIALIALIIGRLLLARYRHHHKFHRKPRSM